MPHGGCSATNHAQHACMLCMHAQVHDSRSRAPPRNARLQARSRAKHGRSTLRRRRMDPEDSEGRSQNHGGGSGEEGLARATERGARGARGRTMLSNAWAGSRSILDYFVLRAFRRHSVLRILPDACMVSQPRGCSSREKRHGQCLCDSH